MKFIKRLFEGFKSQSSNLDEEYLSNSSDIYEVEYKIRQLEQGLAPHQGQKYSQNFRR